uniref:TNFR-Cys domain-containing protein n=1 Tax=Terrapene triunguis TaxID=2587831 RepID=A0A674IA64_9SAUR
NVIWPLTSKCSSWFCCVYLISFSSTPCKEYTAIVLNFCFSLYTGTYVSEHCKVPHTEGICYPCTDGEDYTAHANGLDECIRCKLCKEGIVQSLVNGAAHVFEVKRMPECL